MGKPVLSNILIAAFVALFLAIAGTKVLLLDYRPDQIIPLEGWNVRISTEATGSGENFSTSHFLPPIEPGQDIENEKFSGDYVKVSTASQRSNRTATYAFHQPLGMVRTSFSFLATTREIRYSLPDSFPIREEFGDEFQSELKAEPLIQKDAPEIVDKARELGLNETENGLVVLQRIFDYCHRQITNAKFSGETDAVLACRLGEASCNGKSRLMVALCRNRGLPARLVGGLILQGREKKTTHQWVEVWINGKWVTFCPLNGHFAQKPANYLAFYRGDHGFFKHNRDLRFDYSFRLETTLVPRDRHFAGHRFLDITSIWRLLEKSGISLATLGILLVIPIGALVTILFRNVVGVQTFGTFLPALIAYAFQGTGLVWGLIIFSAIILGGAGLDALVSRLKLLHTPRLTFLMVFVVAALLSFGVYGILHGNASLAKSLFFPLAVHTITIERFFVIAQERGPAKSFAILGWTMLVVGFCYMVMSSLVLQMAVVFFPESYLLILASSLYLGRWKGLRVAELFRFRKLIFADSSVKSGKADHASE